MRDRLLRVAADGSLLLPPDALRLLGVSGGGDVDVVLRFEEGRVVLVSAAAAAAGRKSAPAARAWGAPYAEQDEEEG